ncbi:DUF6896 domain-containing protein [Myroides odoratus]|uniref:DUF6896 domain-containing protein n=1 Tax=Myroides odoratus TaxID=256 RepID=UPI0021676B8A|nr:hypothetical protein [Myroides odoratus]MCS4237361.1 hypothetical protein [Myroides odoratus]
MGIKQSIIDFRKFVLDFEGILRKELGLVEEDVYQEIHKLFSKSKGSINYKRGNIKGYYYQYHGAGCFVEKDGVKCDFNYSRFIEDLTYQITAMKLKDFIDSYYYLVSDEKELNDQLVALAKEGFIEQLIEDGRVYNSFLIKRYK